MQAARIKRGASFKAMITFDENEWQALYPWTGIEAKLKQGSRETILAVTTEPAARRVTVTAGPAQTALWVTGPNGSAPASFDVWVTRGAEVLPVPASHNIPLTVIEGVSR